jgi:hypothetical protein
LAKGLEHSCGAGTRLPQGLSLSKRRYRNFKPF